jgi:hypothetical protein
MTSNDHTHVLACIYAPAPGAMHVNPAFRLSTLQVLNCCCETGIEIILARFRALD